MEARDLRVSDAEREHVGQLLQRAVGQGMLSLGEFTERMDTALASKTRGELNSVLADLPGMQIAGEHLPSPKPFADPTPQPTPRRVVQEHWGHGGGTPDTVRGSMSTITRKGPRNVPRRLNVVTRLSSFLSVARIVAHTELLVVVPRILGEVLATQEPVQLLEPPFALPSYAVKQHWHERYHHDPANRWIRALVAELLLQQ